MGLLKKLAADHPDVPVVMITAHGSVENAVEAVKLGAFDYVEKPFDQEQIRQVVAKALKTHAFSRRDPSPAEPAGTTPGRFRLVGDSPAIRHIYAIIEKVAEHALDGADHRRVGHGQGADRPGAAREQLAAGRAVHQDQLRRHPQDADGVELFGYEKGAFTGAVGPSPGGSSWPRRARCSSTRSGRSRSRCR
jgi:DNA-binding NtrC family response regulator